MIVPIPQTTNRVYRQRVQRRVRKWERVSVRILPLPWTSRRPRVALPRSPILRRNLPRIRGIIQKLNRTLQVLGKI